MKRTKRRPGWVWLPVVERRLGAQHAVFIAGSGRSGTTWLAQLINHDHVFRYYHEPFGPAVWPALRPVLYLRRENRDERYVVPVERILRGYRISNWARSNDYNRSVQPYDRVVFSKRLIKECRANLWLHWLRARYPELPLVFMMRHPVAVAHSTIQRRLPNVYQEYFLQRELLEDHLAPFYDRMLAARAGPEWDQHILNWCIQNYVPLRELTRHKTHLVFYENLILHPEQEMESLFAFVGQPLNDNAKLAFAKPSSTTRHASAIRTGASLVTQWKDEVSGSDQRRALELVTLFGLDTIYSTEVLPIANAAEVLPGQRLGTAR